MIFLKRTYDIKSIRTFYRQYSYGRKTHYETLNLSKNCTDKEIKDAFIKMSKEYHPDKNKDMKAHEKFVQIVEAYNVLGKPGSRAEYDNTTYVNSGTGGDSYVYKTHVPYNLRKNPNYNFYDDPHETAKSSKSESYYGFKGVKKVSNVAIIAICFGIAVIGVILQYAVIRKSYYIHRRQMQEKSQKLSDELERVRASTYGKTNEMQTQILLDRIISAANSSAATASLGQALANEKK